jgi:hypothetical protein
MVVWKTDESDDMSKDQHSPPLMLFGLDAGDAEYIRHWAQAGYLPTWVVGGTSRARLDVNTRGLAFLIQRAPEA